MSSSLHLALALALGNLPVLLGELRSALLSQGLLVNEGLALLLQPLHGLLVLLLLLGLEPRGFLGLTEAFVVSGVGCDDVVSMRGRSRQAGKVRKARKK